MNVVDKLGGLFSYGISKIKWLLVELLRTFSIELSFFSSKRIERFLFTSTVISIVWEINMRNIGKWTAFDHMLTLTPLLIAAGYNITQERLDKTLIKPPDGSDGTKV